eukprot:11168019-Lingulodinium_polyedra.AAC.1
MAAGGTGSPAPQGTKDHLADRSLRPGQAQGAESPAAQGRCPDPARSPPPVWNAASVRCRPRSQNGPAHVSAWGCRVRVGS